MPTALVTGAAGFIGSHIAETLLERGDTVHGIDNLSTGRQQNLRTLEEYEGFTFHEADIRDSGTIEKIADTADTVFHQAAVASVQKSIDDPAATTDINCTGTATVLDAARRAGVETAVVASSSAVYGSEVNPPLSEIEQTNPESPYALSKRYTEDLTRQYGEFYDIDTVALRYFNVFGSRQDPNGEYAAVIPAFIGRLLDGKRPIIYGDGEQTRDFIHVDDIVQANLEAAASDRSGIICNIGCGGRITINELADTLNSVLGTELDPLYEDPRPGDIRHSHSDISKARELLDYEPTIEFKTGLERTIEYYREVL